jgi:SAM-dependent methyltransferase
MLHLWGLPTSGTIEDIFTEIYKRNKWRFGSGAGSLKRVCTEYVKYLNEFIGTHDIKSVLDVGCGDWQFSEDINWGDVEYLGIDVVDYLMGDVAKKYETDKIKFHSGDIHSIKFDHYDVILIKEVMIHLPNEEIKKMLQKVSGRCKYLIITNPVSNSPNCNIDIKTGSFRPVDITEKPFNLSGETLQLFPKRKDIQTVVIEDFKYEI